MKSSIILDRFIQTAKMMGDKIKTFATPDNFIRAALIVASAAPLTACGGMGIDLGGPTVQASDLVENPAVKGVGLVCTAIIEHDDNVDKEKFLYATIGPVSSSTAWYAATATGKLGLESGVQVEVEAYTSGNAYHLKGSFSQLSRAALSPNVDGIDRATTDFSNLPLPSEDNVERALRYIADVAIIRATREDYGNTLCSLDTFKNKGFGPS